MATRVETRIFQRLFEIPLVLKNKRFKEASFKCDPCNGVRYVTILVLSHVPTFVGLDASNYSLDAGDAVLVPSGNARILCKRKLAVRVNDIGDDASELDDY